MSNDQRSRLTIKGGWGHTVSAKPGGHTRLYQFLSLERCNNITQIISVLLSTGRRKVGRRCVSCRSRSPRWSGTASLSCSSGERWSLTSRTSCRRWRPRRRWKGSTWRKSATSAWRRHRRDASWVKRRCRTRLRYDEIHPEYQYKAATLKDLFHSQQWAWQKLF